MHTVVTTKPFQETSHALASGQYMSGLKINVISYYVIPKHTAVYVRMYI